MKLKFAITLLTLFVTTAAFGHYPGKIKIDAAQKKQPAVAFDHATHGDKRAKDCGTCHHTQKTLTKALVDKMDVKKCQECHLDPKDPKIPSMREMSLTKNPMHIRCISCHKEQKKGPVVCTGCHKK
jgi:hypothetical protein